MVFYYIPLLKDPKKEQPMIVSPCKEYNNKRGTYFPGIPHITLGPSITNPYCFLENY